MQPNGTTLVKQEENRQQWNAWLCQARRRRPAVGEFAVKLTKLIEARVGSPTSQHVAQLAEQALEEAGRDQLTERQVREVLTLLLDVWKYGLALRNWASRQGIMD